MKHLLIICALLACGFQGLALASPPLPHAMERLPPSLRSAAIQKLAQASAHRAPVAGLDVTPPQLRAFNISDTLNVGQLTGHLNLDVSISDDWSGLSTYSITYTHEDGSQSRTETMGSAWGVLSTRDRGRLLLAFGGSGLTMKPGRWRVTELWAVDLADNMVYYDESQLVALGGNTRFTVNNPNYEAVSPTLVSGRLSATQLSRSAIRSGTAATPEILSLSLEAADSGAKYSYGPSWAEVWMCNEAETQCLSLAGGAVSRPRKALITTGRDMSADVPLGTFHLHTITVYDGGNNHTEYRSTRFGGTTDFSRYFPGTQVVIKP